MSPRDRLVLMVVGVIAIAGAAWVLLVSPERDKASQAQSALSAAQAQQATAAGALQSARTAQASFPKNVVAVALLNRAVPSVDDVGTILRQLEATGKRDGIDFRSLKVSASAASAAAPAPPPAGTPAAAAKAAALAPGSIPSSTYALDFVGSFLQLERFLGDVFGTASITPTVIKANGRLVNVLGVKLTASADTPGKMDATVNASAYVLPQGESPDKLITALGNNPAAVAEEHAAEARAGGARVVTVPAPGPVHPLGTKP